MKLQDLPLRATTPSAPESADAPPLLPITADWRLDVAGQRLVGPSGEVLLPALEFRLLEVFRHHPHRVLSRDQLLDLAWGPAFDGTDRAVDRAIYRLRCLLEPDPGRPRYLRTRRGAGYSVGDRGMVGVAPPATSRRWTWPALYHCTERQRREARRLE